MNCKPGDLAFYRGLEIEHHGKIVRVVEPVEPPKRPGAIKSLYWKIDPPLIVRGVARFKCADVSLCPIGNPGDDEVDETLREMEAA